MLPVSSVDCPYCGESIELVIDDSAGSQQYVEDCFVCCRPIEVFVMVDDDGDVAVTCRTDSET